MEVLLKLFTSFIKIGCFSFGGGYAMIALVSQEVVRNCWLTKEQVIDFLAISESTPGPFTVNASTYVGQLVAGMPGAIVATIAAILPSVIIICVVAKNFSSFSNSKYVKAAFVGLKPIVIALIASAIFDVCRTVLFESFNYMKTIYVTITVLMTLYLVKKINPIYIICISAFVGLIFGSIFCLPY